MKTRIEEGKHMIGNVNSTTKVELVGENIKNATIQVLVGPEQGWDSHVMRLIELESGGNTPRHEHPWPHINYVVEGKGILMIDDEEHEVNKGTYAYIPENHIHQFRNPNQNKFVFICIVPKEGHR